MYALIAQSGVLSSHGDSSPETTAAKQMTERVNRMYARMLIAGLEKYKCVACR